MTVQLARHGGASGSRDVGLQSSALARPHNRKLMASEAQGVAITLSLDSGEIPEAGLAAELLARTEPAGRT
jgi:hypothetical protein